VVQLDNEEMAKRNPHEGLPALHQADLENLRGALMIILEIDSMLQAGKVEKATRHARHNAQVISKAFIERHNQH
jgi:hypothetical protein